MATRQQKHLPPIHPGEVLQGLLEEAGLTANAPATTIRLPANLVGGIIKGQRGITADTALRLARYFGTSAQMWVNLQASTIWRPPTMPFAAGSTRKSSLTTQLDSQHSGSEGLFPSLIDRFCISPTLGEFLGRA